eukprot:1998651-Pleurochrysis_carterae.AAC.1
MFHWWDLESGDDVFSAQWKLYMHVCADFGAAAAPGTCNRFFVDVLLGIARSENVLTLALAVHVDDMGLIGPPGFEMATDAMGNEFTLGLSRVGVSVKSLKDRPAATTQ